MTYYTTLNKIREKEWLPIDKAPKDGTELLLAEKCTLIGRWVYSIGSFRVDEGFSGDEKPLWLDNSYNEYSMGYESTPLNPSHFQYIISPEKMGVCDD